MEKKTEKNVEAKHEKQKLKDVELDPVAGGAGFNKARCPRCGSLLKFLDGKWVCSECNREI